MFVLPDNLSELDLDALVALQKDGSKALKDLKITAESDEATLDEGERIADLLDTLVPAIADKRKHADRIARLTKASDTPVEPEPPAETPPAETPPAETPPAETPPAEDPPVAPGEGEVVEGEDNVVPIAAGIRRARATDRVAANGSPPAVPPSARTPNVIHLNAAPDVPGFSNGQELDGIGAAVKALQARIKTLPRTNLSTRGEPVRQRFGAAVISKEGYGDLVQDSGMEDYDMVWESGKENRLPGGSLVAAGGWCAPSETLYDMCQLETVEGILSVPEFQVRRGGIRWTTGPDFADIYANCGFEQTEADAIAGECKTCCTVECPEFDEIRLDAVGVCVKSPLLTERAYPELTRRFLEGSLVAHAHKVNAYNISKILAAAGATPMVAADSGALSRSMSSMELSAMGMRYRYRLGDSRTIEVVAPMWLKTAMRMDIGLQWGAPDVSDAFINSWFAQRNMNVQWVFDWQDLADDAGEGEVIIPANADVLMYPSGTWSKGVADIIQMDAVYDSAGLESNMFTALFLEEGILMVQRCTQTLRFRVPVCISGRTAANNISACLATPTVA